MGEFLAAAGFTALELATAFYIVSAALVGLHKAGIKWGDDFKDLDI